jgi:hypothetical protein
MNGTPTPLTAWQRFLLAFIAFFAVLFNRRFAEEVAQVHARTRGALPPAPPSVPPPSPPTDPAVRAADVSPSPGVRGEGPATPLSPAAPAPKPAPAARPAVAPAPAVKVRDHAEALHVLSLLQRDGRLIDFLAEDLAGFSDAEIGAAARTVHEGCKKALDTYLQLEPVLRDAEGATVTVSAGFDPATIRLTGNVVGSPPFRGALRHHGWRATKATFPPPPTHDPKIIAPAEVEL